MSKVALLIENVGSARAKVAAALYKYLNLGLGQVTRAIDQGEPIFERPLFPREDPHFANQLLTVLESLDALDIRYTAYELLDDQNFKDENPNGLYKITIDGLRQLIASRDKSIEQLRRHIDQEEVD